ncbi:MAG TPA: M48 family metalloprotease [Thermoanaerobaculia bacterium]|nr:M48 family metalloprotease [Thermoanaerobaculia bacterium]
MASSKRPFALLVVLSGFLAAATSSAQTVQDPDLFGKSLEVARQALEHFGVGQDEAEVERVAEIGYRVAQESNFDRVPFTFHVVEMSAPNAFALPGGQIFVTTGMLRMGVTDDMLAGLLGHEIGHVVEQHGMKMERRATLLQVLSQALVIGALVGAGNSGRSNEGIQAPYDPRTGYDDPRAEMVQGVAASTLALSELLLRSYSRDFEREADDEGQRYAAAAGFTPEGMRDLMALMRERLPQSKDFGYWQTHPFFEERVRGAEVRAGLLIRQPAKTADAYRARTQQALLQYAKVAKVKPEASTLLETQALTTWPKGTDADQIRLTRLHAARKEVLDAAPLERDYGELLTRYRTEQARVERLDPASSLLTTLGSEIGELETGRAEAYPKAIEVVAGGVWETPFLERFLSNYPQAAEAPKVALALGDAKSRLGKPAEAVRHYLAALELGPTTPEGQRALSGLKVLAGLLEDLAALEELARQQDDPGLAGLARKRLAAVAGSFKDLTNGSEYLKQYPAGSQAEPVAARLEVIADQLYTEVVLYQGIGDSVKALDRIQQILTHAPTSRAAARLREGAVVSGAS